MVMYLISYLKTACFKVPTPTPQRWSTSGVCLNLHYQYQGYKRASTQKLTLFRTRIII